MRNSEDLLRLPLAQQRETCGDDIHDSVEIDLQVRLDELRCSVPNLESEFSRTKARRPTDARLGGRRKRVGDAGVGNESVKCAVAQESARLEFRDGTLSAKMSERHEAGEGEKVLTLTSAAFSTSSFRWKSRSLPNSRTSAWRSGDPAGSLAPATTFVSFDVDKR